MSKRGARGYSLDSCPQLPPRLPHSTSYGDRDVPALHPLSQWSLPACDLHSPGIATSRLTGAPPHTPPCSLGPEESLGNCVVNQTLKPFKGSYDSLCEVTTAYTSSIISLTSLLPPLPVPQMDSASLKHFLSPLPGHSSRNPLPWANPDMDISRQLRCPTVLDTSKLLRALPDSPAPRTSPLRHCERSPGPVLQVSHTGVFYLASLSQHA